MDSEMSARSSAVRFDFAMVVQRAKIAARVDALPASLTCSPCRSSLGKSVNKENAALCTCTPFGVLSSVATHGFRQSSSCPAALWRRKCETEKSAEDALQRQIA